MLCKSCWTILTFSAYCKVFESAFLGVLKLRLQNAYITLVIFGVKGRQRERKACEREIP